LKKFVGIDVGKLGGIVSISEDGKTVVTKKTPLNGKEIDVVEIKQLLQLLSLENEVIVGIENVSSIMGSASGANFQFGRALGLVEGVTVGVGLPFVKVHAKTWQKLAFEGIPVQYKPGKPKKNRKTGLLEPTQKVDTKAMAEIAAKRLYPNVSLLATSRSSVAHSGIVDSLLIAHYLLKTNK
jgi:hypothetical protein